MLEVVVGTTVERPLTTSLEKALVESVEATLVGVADAAVWLAEIALEAIEIAVEVDSPLEEEIDDTAAEESLRYQLA